MYWIGQTFLLHYKYPHYISDKVTNLIFSLISKLTLKKERPQ